MIYSHSFCLACHTGDILGSSMNNLDRLVRMPYGCGEQNMVNFAPNIYVMKYLQTVNQLTTLLKNKAERFMISGQCSKVSQVKTGDASWRLCTVSGPSPFKISIFTGP